MILLIIRENDIFTKISLLSVNIFTIITNESEQY